MRAGFSRPSRRSEKLKPLRRVGRLAQRGGHLIDDLPRQWVVAAESVGLAVANLARQLARRFRVELRRYDAAAGRWPIRRRDRRPDCQHQIRVFALRAGEGRRPVQFKQILDGLVGQALQHRRVPSQGRGRKRPVPIVWHTWCAACATRCTPGHW